MNVDHYTDAKLKLYIFTEALLMPGGAQKSMNYHPSSKSDGSTTSNAPFFRSWGVPQWSREKHRYLTYEEWQVEQKKAEADAVRLGANLRRANNKEYH